jgi:mannose-6-phosphate isomerase-like protein (cupin superfamily)
MAKIMVTKVEMLRTRQEMSRISIEKCHDGIGSVESSSVVEPNESEVGIQFMHDDILPPGATVGEHPHTDEEEIYFIVEGHGTLILDGREYPVAAGDVSLLRRGHSHGIKNSMDGPMRMLVVQVKSRSL